MINLLQNVQLIICFFNRLTAPIFNAKLEYMGSHVNIYGHFHLGIYPLSNCYSVWGYRWPIPGSLGHKAEDKPIAVNIFLK